MPEVIFTSQCSAPKLELNQSLRESTGNPSSTFFMQTGGSLNLGSSSVKRGRFLIRQQRIKKDGDTICEGEASNETYSSTEYLLTVPSTASTNAKIERHASEPSPSSLLLTSQNNSNLLTVNSPHVSYLVKQHSHPLLPSQMTTSSGQLTRQMSYPSQMIAQHQSTSSSVFCSSQMSDCNANEHHSQSKNQMRSQTLPNYMSETEIVSERTQPAGSQSVVLITETPPDHESNISMSHHPQQPIHQKQLQLPSIRVKSEELQRSISSPSV